MTIKDVIKDKVYAGLIGDIGWNLGEIVFVFLVACILGIYIFEIYRRFSKSAFYSRDLNITIAGMTVVVAAIMIAMQSSLIVSLGMVGALSIVRFRNAVKNPIDLLYLFWAVSVGIICGVGLYILAAALCVMMTLLLWGLEKIPVNKAPVLLILESDQLEVDWEEITAIIKRNCKFYKEKSHCIRQQNTEVIMEIKCEHVEKLVGELRNLEKLSKINYLQHDGESRV